MSIPNPFDLAVLEGATVKVQNDDRVDVTRMTGKAAVHMIYERRIREWMITVRVTVAGCYYMESHATDEVVTFWNAAFAAHRVRKEEEAMQQFADAAGALAESLRPAADRIVVR